MWDGTVEVDVSSEPLTLGPGERVSYRMRLSQQPLSDHNDGKWWVRIFVDGAVRMDHPYKGISWTPSVGWEFNLDNWNQWRSVSIEADNTVEKNTVITFTHEVWATSDWCPTHNVGKVTVKVNWDEGDVGGGTTDPIDTTDNT